jgi:O-antigen/teichoic acid export membrane protein
MISKIRTFITNKINRSNERSTNVIKNVIASFLIKGISIVAQLLLIPLTINYINPTQYGIWLTLSSIVAWFAFFDVGFGNGLRNRFAEARATGNYTKAKAYVSTTYVCLGIIFTIIWALFFFVNFFIDWSVVLNAPAQTAKELSTVAIVVFSFFCVQIILKTMNTVLIADQKPAKSSLFDMLGQVLALLIIIVLTKTTSGSLLYLSLAWGVSPILIVLLSSFWFYNHEYKRYRPSIRLFNRDIVKDIITLGSKFFIIQIAVIVVFQTTNIIIIQILTPQDVTVYNIVYKYFSIASMVFTIIMTPLWSAYTDAYAKNDFEWIHNIIRKTILFWGLLAAVSVIMVIASRWVYEIWVGDDVASSIPLHTSVACAVYIIIVNWCSIYVYFLNGVGKIKLQLYNSVGIMLVYIPVSIFMCTVFGITGVVVALCIMSLPGAVCMPVQCNKLFKGIARGIWNE